jgi:hypothetical protein
LANFADYRNDESLGADSRFPALLEDVSMSGFARLVCLVGLAVGAAPLSLRPAFAQTPACCHSCQQPVTRCGCQANPVRRVVKERDVVSTEYRREPVTETVPMTVTENVTVDEGSYQTVWVPKLTSRPVARTVYQTRTGYRSVPYQVTRRVQEYGYEGYSTQTMIGGAYRPYAPAISATPIRPAAPMTASGAGLSPDPLFSASAYNGYGSGYGYNPPRPAPNYRYDEYQSIDSDAFGRGVAGGPSLGVAAPSAAQVWRNRGTSLR